jgi:hypothetical protein
MNDLIERLAKATGPDRALDLAIERAVNVSTIHDDHLDRFPEDAKVYTASIDAALTLVPKDSAAEITGQYDWQLECINGGLTISARVGADEKTRSFADTPAIALCIAALKALTPHQQGDSK